MSKTCKKLLASALAATMLFSTFVSSLVVSAAATGTLKIGTETITVGTESATVDFTLTFSEAVTAPQDLATIVAKNANEETLAIIGAELGEVTYVVDGEETKSPIIDGVVPDEDVEPPTVSVSGTNLDAGKILFESGVAGALDVKVINFTVTFDTSKAAVGTYTVTATTDATDHDEADVVVTTEDGAIVVEEPHTCTAGEATDNGDGTHDIACAGNCGKLFADNEDCNYVEGICDVCGAEDPNYEPPVVECQHSAEANRTVTFENSAINYNTVCSLCGEIIAVETVATDDASTVASTINGLQSYAAIEVTEIGDVAIDFTLPEGKTSSDIKVAYIDGANVMAANQKNADKVVPYDVLSVSYSDGIATVSTKVIGVVVVFTLEDSSKIDPILTSNGMASTFTLGSAIIMRFGLNYLAIDDVFDSWYAVIEHEGYEGNTPVSFDPIIMTEYVQDGNYHYFDYPITAKAMGDDVTCSFYAVKNGVSYLIRVKEDYSLLAYSLTAGTGFKGSDGKLKTLLADMLLYGAQAQKAFSYNTNNLVSLNKDVESYVNEYASNKIFDSTELAAMKKSSSDYPNVTVNGNSVKSIVFTKTLNLKDRVEMVANADFTNFVAANGSMDGVTFIIKYTDPASNTVITKELTKDDFEVVGYKYSLVFKEYPARMMDETITLTVNYNGEYYAETVYSVNSYLATNYTSSAAAANGASNKLGDICKAIAAYGNSAFNYFQK